jgi:hypothetical protein
MTYHILQTHPQLGKLLSAGYNLGAAQRNAAKWALASDGWTYRVVRCLAPEYRDCLCSRDDTFEVMPDS